MIFLHSSIVELSLVAAQHLAKYGTQQEIAVSEWVRIVTRQKV